jgi:hypothetical protein
MPDSLAAGQVTYKVVNTGKQIHELNIVKVAAGKTVDDVLTWEKAPARADALRVCRRRQWLQPRRSHPTTAHDQTG